MRIRIEADGGSRGNPGVAGSGTVLIEVPSERVLGSIAYYGGKTTNNVAEYASLINGLEAARELGATAVDVFMDSKLVIEQMSGRWKVKHPDMKELALKAQKLAATFDSISYTWVPRAKNKAADALANQAMDAGAKGAPVGFVSRDIGEIREDSTDGQTDKAYATQPTTQAPATSAPTRLICWRHGETDASVNGRYSGDTGSDGPELTERGRQQAQRTADYLKKIGGIDAVVCSPARRAQQTAQMLTDDYTVIDDLHEMDFGTWEGLTFGQAHDKDPELHSTWLSDPAAAPPGGESLNQVSRRIKGVLAELTDTHGPANIVVVTHATPIKALIKLALDAAPAIYYRTQIDLSSLTIIEFYADGPTCLRAMNTRP